MNTASEQPQLKFHLSHIEQHCLHMHCIFARTPKENITMLCRQWGKKAANLPVSPINEAGEQEVVREQFSQPLTPELKHCSVTRWVCHSIKRKLRTEPEYSSFSEVIETEAQNISTACLYCLALQLQHSSIKIMSQTLGLHKYKTSRHVNEVDLCNTSSTTSVHQSIYQARHTFQTSNVFIHEDSVLYFRFTNMFFPPFTSSARGHGK